MTQIGHKFATGLPGMQPYDALKNLKNLKNSKDIKTMNNEYSKAIECLRQSHREISSGRYFLAELTIDQGLDLVRGKEALRGTKAALLNNLAFIRLQQGLVEEAREIQKSSATIFDALGFEFDYKNAAANLDTLNNIGI
ncbi:MAG: hypothetical protein IPM23_17770 [Candidatus Melainabacteria bacterium]|nr:hypothetical protein [Candidatus Melainabacteria bacterium]